MPGHLDSIVALQQTLNQLADAETRLHGIPDWMRELHDEHQARREEIEAAQQIEDEATRARREAEAVISDAQEKLRRYQSQIGQVSTQREYGALLKEIDTVKEEIANAEKIAMDSIEKAEEAAGQRTELEEKFRELDERYQAELSRWESQKPEVAAAVSSLQNQVATLRDEIPRNLQTLFDRLLERSGEQALARVARAEAIRRGGNATWHCTACHYQVRPQVVVEIRNQGALVQCDSCKRILYFEDTAASS